MTANWATPFSMSGKTVLVFGAGGPVEGWNNGKAAAYAYARAGAQVCCADLDIEAAERVAHGIVAEGGEAFGIRADVTNSTSVGEVVDALIARWKKIDVLHNNVGATHMGGPVELDEATFQRSVDLNLGSVFRAAKAVLPHMIAQGGGAIVNISSLAAIGWTGYPYFAYAASKAAVNQATVSIAMQHARQGIRANCVMPGAIDTPLIYAQIAKQYASVDEMVAARNRMVPIGKMGDPWDVAHASLFLASDAAKFITGVSLAVDGGQSASMVPLQ